jgi:hypothetical protein
MMICGSQTSPAVRQGVFLRMEERRSAGDLAVLGARMGSDGLHRVHDVGQRSDDEL